MVEISITSEPIDPSKAITSVMQKNCGGIVTFIGTIRDSSDGRPVKSIEVEAFDEMAIKDLQSIIDRAKKKHSIGSVTIVHRKGRLSPGEIVVVIAVSAPHRKDAFDVCREIIDEMKKTTPIWKEELLDGSRKWVEGESQ